MDESRELFLQHAPFYMIDRVLNTPRINTKKNEYALCENGLVCKIYRHISSTDYVNIVFIRSFSGLYFALFYAGKYRPENS